jgi:hypothetical protein
MSEQCAALETHLAELDWSADRDALMAWLDQADGVEGCIATGLATTATIGDWSLFERYVVAGHRRPSREYSNTLCNVLRSRSDEINNEDIVDVLAEIRDPASVDCLAYTLSWSPSWDEFHQLAIKCVWALAAIGTVEAFVVLRDAAASEAIEVREAISQMLPDDD